MNINYFMNEAIKEARYAFNNNEVPVGGILVDNNTNEIIERSFNKVNKDTKFPTSLPLFPLAISAISGFFFWGINDEPVVYSSEI